MRPGETLSSATSVDIIIRYGEGRFVVILPETSADSARIAAERIRYAVEKNAFRVGERPIKLTVSIGLIGFDPAIHRDKNDVLKMLDQTLVEGRKSGPNRVAMAATNSG